MPCIEKLPHSCGSSDGLQVFEEKGEYTGWCFVCQTYVPHPYEDKPADYKPKRVVKTQEEIQAELDEISKYQCVDIPSRSLKEKYIDYFGIKVGVSQQDGITPVSYHWPYYKDGRRVAYKNRIVGDEKRIWSTGDQKDVDFFGWDQAVEAGAKRLIITEGEWDAVALTQILMERNRGTAYEKYYPSVVSLPHGCGNAAQFIASKMNKINATFKEVVLAFDNDDPGRQAVQDVLKIAPKFLSATLPAKDANDCLMEGRSKACASAVLFQAAKPKNSRIVYGSSLREAARKEAEWGYSYPFAKLTDLTRGMRMGETVYWGAGVKMGKSELVNTLAAHCIMSHDLPVFLAKPEESNQKTYQMMVGKAAGKIFHDPKIPFDFEAYDKAEPMIGDKVAMVNLYQHLGWATLKSDVNEAAMQGYKVVMIDPITNLINELDSGQANTVLTSIAADLSAMALDLDIAVHIFCHLKAPALAPSHERGGQVLSHQFAGSRAMMRSCNYMIGMEGNKDPELPIEERNLRDLVVLEDREFGNVGRVPLYWDQSTGLFEER
jgi:twinkle protein